MAGTNAPKENLSVPSSEAPNEKIQAYVPKLTEAQRKVVHDSLPVDEQAFVDGKLKSIEQKETYYFATPDQRAVYREDVLRIENKIGAKKETLFNRSSDQQQVASAKASGVNKWGDVDPTSMLG